MTIAIGRTLKVTEGSFAGLAAAITATLTLLAFVIAIMTPPLSGPFCIGDCFKYPYHDIKYRFPRDYFWMFAALPQTLSFLIMAISIHVSLLVRRKNILGISGVAFGMMSTLTLFTDYFMQISIVQASLLSGEYDGLALLSQYNPHGIFIALEEIGFFFAAISLWCLSALFSGNTLIEKVVRRTGAICALLVIGLFIWLAALYGVKREYRFEVFVISIVWLETIFLGIVFSRYFMKDLRKPRS